jgi:hypothetical protein
MLKDYISVSFLLSSATIGSALGIEKFGISEMQRRFSLSLAAPGFPRPQSALPAGMGVIWEARCARCPA